MAHKDPAVRRAYRRSRRAHDRELERRRRARPEVKQIRRDQDFKRKYGLSPEDYQVLKDSQGGVCAICGKEGILYVDHDHDTGAVRGMLCPPCNTAIGAFGDTLMGLLRAVTYLKSAST